MDTHDFDGYVEELCQQFYATTAGLGCRYGATSGCC